MNLTERAGQRLHPQQRGGNDDDRSIARPFRSEFEVRQQLNFTGMTHQLQRFLHQQINFFQSFAQASFPSDLLHFPALMRKRTSKAATPSNMSKRDLGNGLRLAFYYPVLLLPAEAHLAKVSSSTIHLLPAN